MAVKYEHVAKLFRCLLAAHEFWKVVDLTMSEHENVRELLIKCRGLWQDNQKEFNTAMEAAQIFTILSNMTFACQMSGGFSISEQSTYVDMNGVAGPRVPLEPAPLREKLMKLCKSFDQVEMLLQELKDARATLQNLQGAYQAYVHEELTQRFVDAENLLANVEAETRSWSSSL